MKLTTIGTVIAERTLDLSPRGKVVVRIGKPRKTRGFNDYFCPFEIRGLGEDMRTYIVGLDSVQALDLTMNYIGAMLYSSEEVKHGRLSWVGGSDLGFPVPEFALGLISKEKPRQPIKRTGARSSSRKKSKRG